MKQNKITIEEIARRANVSIATVSRVINHKDKVKPETKQKVMAVIEELKFYPKTSAPLSNAASRVILVCVPEFHNPFNSPVIEGIQKSARSRGYDVLFLQSRDFYTSIDDYSNILKNYSIAGILIVASVPNAKLIDELMFRCPVVMCSEYAENYGISYVSIDDVAAAKKAVNYLISTGRRKIGFINSNLNFKYARHREKGYKEALTTAGLEINPNWIAHISTINYKMALSSCSYILGLPDHPDALFACSDVFAVGAVNAARQLGLNVPHDVSIIGFDDVELAIMTSPTITTVRQPCFQLGYQSCELLVDKIETPTLEDKQIILDTELVVRDSTILNLTAGEAHYE